MPDLVDAIGIDMARTHAREGLEKAATMTPEDRKAWEATWDVIDSLAYTADVYRRALEIAVEEVDWCIADPSDQDKRNVVSRWIDDASTRWRSPMTELEEIKAALRERYCKGVTHYPGCPCSILRVIEALEANAIPGLCKDCGCGLEAVGFRVPTIGCDLHKIRMAPEGYCSDFTRREAGRE